MNDYIISGGRDGKSRLNVLSDVLRKDTKALLEKCGVAPGSSFLDLGCGGGNVAMLAAEMVGAAGSVTAIDFDEEIIALAKQDAVAAGIGNVSFEAGSAYDIDYSTEFDFAYARFLLSHLKEPLEVLKKMKQGVKPGGKIIVEDVHFSGHFCYPANIAFDRYLEYYTLAAQQNGMDANIGPSLVSLFHNAGIEDVNFDVIQPCFSSGDGKWMGYLTMDRIKASVVDHGIAHAQAVDSVLHELEAFTKDEQTIISLPRIFRVWGVKE